MRSLQSSLERKMRRTVFVPLLLFFCPFTRSDYEGEDYDASTSSAYEDYYQYDSNSVSADYEGEEEKLKTIFSLFFFLVPSYRKYPV